MRTLFAGAMCACKHSTWYMISITEENFFSIYLRSNLLTKYCSLSMQSLNLLARNSKYEYRCAIFWFTFYTITTAAMGYLFQPCRLCWFYLPMTKSIYVVCELFSNDFILNIPYTSSVRLVCQPSLMTLCRTFSEDFPGRFDQAVMTLRRCESLF